MTSEKKTTKGPTPPADAPQTVVNKNNIILIEMAVRSFFVIHKSL